jgi:hypothetical protein
VNTTCECGAPRRSHLMEGAFLGVRLVVMSSSCVGAWAVAGGCLAADVPMTFVASRSIRSRRVRIRG